MMVIGRFPKKISQPLVKKSAVRHADGAMPHFDRAPRVFPRFHAVAQVDAVVAAVVKALGVAGQRSLDDLVLVRLQLVAPGHKNPAVRADELHAVGQAFLVRGVELGAVPS